LKKGTTRKKTRSIRVRLKTPIYNAMMKIIDSGAYLNPSKYVEDLVLRDLEKLGLEPVEDHQETDTGDQDKSGDKSGVISIRLPKPVLSLIEKLTHRGYFLKPSDYVRYTIMRDLEARGLLQELLKIEAEEKPKTPRRPSEAIIVSTLVPAAIMDEIDKLIKSGLYLRASDYLMDLIIKDLERRGNPDTA